MCSFFIKRRYDVIFYYPQHFNRDNKGENIYFTHLINACKQKKISYVIFEEPDFTSISRRNRNAVPFDFIFLIIVFFRKIFNSEMHDRVKDIKIGGFLSKTFFTNITFNNVITISQSMVSIFRGIDGICPIFDVQHGIIHPDKLNYLTERNPDENLLENKLQLLLSGIGYKTLIMAKDSKKYFQTNSHVIGSHIKRGALRYNAFNNNILVALQFTHDHSDNENTIFLNKFKEIINSINDKNITFYLKNHPRFNNEIDLTTLLSLKNVRLAPIDVNDCFELCSLQITAYSTLVFEAGLQGIPTILVCPISKYNYFKTYFHYPFFNTIQDFFDQKFYKESSIKVQAWASSYYSDFDKTSFTNLLR